MNVDQLLLNINDVKFDDMVSIETVQTEEDKKKLSEQGYTPLLTKGEFEKRFPDVNVKHVWYLPTLSGEIIYFNKETLAACQIPVMAFLDNNGEDSPFKHWNGDISRLIKSQETDVKNLKFFNSLYALPEGMRIPYFDKMLEIYGPFSGLYQLFMSFYQLGDYGCGQLKPETMRAILGTKLPEEKEKTAQRLSQLPDMIPIYRGGSYEVSTPAEKAFSWTMDINVANFFAIRRGSKKAYIAEALVPKEKVFECNFDDFISEMEVMAFPNDISIRQIHDLEGISLAERILPKIMDLYSEYVQILHWLDFSYSSKTHNKTHAARVLLLALTIAELMELSDEDKKILAEAAIYHDSRRQNDGPDIGHGKRAGQYYLDEEECPDEIVRFLIECHCLSDKEGAEYLSKNEGLREEEDRVRLLLNIFKDADSLDFVRFGIRTLDMNFLHCPVSKTLTLFARISYEQIEEIL